MKKKSFLLILLFSVYLFSSCTVTQSVYQPAEPGRSASSYSYQEKTDYLNRYGLKDYYAKFGR